MSALAVLGEMDVGKALGPYLGRALEENQVRRMVVSAVFFFFLNNIVASASGSYSPAYQRLGKYEQKSWNAWVVSIAHCLAVCAICVTLVVSPDVAIEEDRAYGWSDRASLAFAISAGFFVYDLYNCYKAKGFDWPYVFHHTACAICYMFVQFPFLPYYAVRFLLYELSTPFLNARLLLIASGDTGSPLLRAVEKCFGITFIIVRIGMGIPLSAMAMVEAYEMYQANRQHSTFVMAYFVLANVGINGLNLYWCSLLLKKAFKKNRADKLKAR